MELLVEAVSKNKRGFLANDTWYNADNALEGEVFKDVKKGMTLEVEASGKWVKEFSIAGGGAVAVVPAKAKPAFAGKSYSPEPKDPSVQDRIGRGNATNAVLGSPYLGALIEKQSGSEAEAIAETKKMIESVAAYINTGTFGEAK